MFFSGPPATILRAWKAGRLVLVVSEEILREYRRVACRFLPTRSTPDVNDFLEQVEHQALIVGPALVPVTACDDADDVKFLACALAGRADHVVSGDKALLRASGFRGVEVITPREFVRRHLGVI
jgi:uncharacterized protein